MLKKSTYNIILHSPEGDSVYFYNTLTRCFFKCSIGLGNKISELLEDANLIEDISCSLLEKLLKGGFIVNNEINELDLVRSYHNREVNNKDYFLTVLPTLNCNYKCWYCIQEHIPSVMLDQTMNDIKAHIRYMIEVERINSLRLDWFGGEPFMYFKKVILPISLYARDLCRTNNIPFFTTTTTNGYFVTPDVAQQLQQINMVNFQITLDGDKENHNKVKFAKGCESSFDYVLNNINSLLSVNANAFVYLRINYTHKTLSTKIVGQVNQHIDQNNRNRITITPHKVWQENPDKLFQIVLKDILKLFKKSGYNVRWMNIQTDFTSCYVNRKFYTAINFNGNCLKCTASNDLYSNDSPGTLNSDGTITWKDFYDIKTTLPTFENDKCRACKYLPICMGLCPREHLKKSSYCKQDVSDEEFDTVLLNFLEDQYED